MAGKRVQTPLVCHGHTRPIVDLEYSLVTPDGYFMTSASKDGQPMLRNGETGDWVGTFQGHKGAVWSCVLNDPALLAATGSADFTARVWDAVTGDEVHQFQHKHIVRTTGFSHGETATKLVTGGPERILRIFDLERPDAPPAEFAAAPDNIRCATWMPDNNLILVSYLDKPNVDVWDVRAAAPVRSLPSRGAVTSIELSGGGRYIVTADGKAVDFRDATSMDIMRTHEVPGYTVESASYSPEHGKYVVGGADMWVHLHDFETGAELDTGKGHHGPVHCVRFAPGGDTYASGSEDGTIRIWQTEFAAAAAAANGVPSAANGTA